MFESIISTLDFTDMTISRFLFKNARVQSGDAEVTDNVSFEVADAQNYPDLHYDLIAFFDCLHDMGNPVGAAKRAYETLAHGWLRDDSRTNGGTQSKKISHYWETYSGASTHMLYCKLRCTWRSGLGAVETEEHCASSHGGGFIPFPEVTETLSIEYSKLGGKR